MSFHNHRIEKNMRTNPLYCLHYIILSSKMLCKMEIQFLLSKGFGIIPKIQKQSVSAVSRNALFSGVGLTGFACYDISRAKTQYWHQQNEPEHAAEFQAMRSGFAAWIGVHKRFLKAIPHN